MNQGALKQKANPAIIIAALAIVGVFVAILAYATTRSPEVAKPPVKTQMSASDYRQKMQESMEKSKTRSSGSYYSGSGGSGGYTPPH